MAGDKGCDADRVRRCFLLRNIESVIPVRNNTREGLGQPPTFHEEKYRDWNVLKRCIDCLKKSGRIATHYGKKLATTKRCCSRLSLVSI